MFQLLSNHPSHGLVTFFPLSRKRIPMDYHQVTQQQAMLSIKTHQILLVRGIYKFVPNLLIGVRITERRISLQRELTTYRDTIIHRSFYEKQVRQFWASSTEMEEFPGRAKLEKLFLAVPASALPQERHLTELKRRCARLHTRKK